jgi:hypothetical protein
LWVYVYMLQAKCKGLSRRHSAVWCASCELGGGVYGRLGHAERKGGVDAMP